MPLTLSEYGAAKKLDVDFVKGLGVAETFYLGARALRIAYLDESGAEVAVRFRLSLDGDRRFAWRKGDKPILYGLNRLAMAREFGFVVMVEGESDAHTLWSHEVPAIALPGASTWREDWAKHLDGIGAIYVVVEPDAGGEAVLRWLRTSAIRERVKLLRLDGFKDPSAMHLDDPERFEERMRDAMSNAQDLGGMLRVEAAERIVVAQRACAELANAPNILDQFVADLHQCGVVGEDRAAKVIYLAVTSRLFERPVSVVVKAPSSSGKSFVVERVLRFFPGRAFYALSAMSEHALAYSEEPLDHRMLVLYEAAGLESDFASYLVRSLLSEGRVRYETVEKTKDGMRPKLIEREGPTALITTTTALALHPENETRMLSVPVTDTPEQTRKILLRIAAGQDDDVDLGRWHAFQTWLESGEHRVHVPFAQRLAALVPPVALRLRRDFGAVLTLVRANALLHREHRERDGDGRIVATVDDYAVVRALVADLIGDGVGATVSATIRETVRAVAALNAAKGVHIGALAEALKLDRSATGRRVRAAIAAGYLTNTETRRGRPSILQLGDPLPEDVAVLPTVETLAGTGDDDPDGGGEGRGKRSPGNGCLTASPALDPNRHGLFGEAGTEAQAIPSLPHCLTCGRPSAEGVPHCLTCATLLASPQTLARQAIEAYRGSEARDPGGMALSPLPPGDSGSVVAGGHDVTAGSLATQGITPPEAQEKLSPATVEEGDVETL